MQFSTIMETYGDWRRYNAGLSELSSLSDRELADLGISRADIYSYCITNSCGASVLPLVVSSMGIVAEF
jgi:uncharacterized protein YjiS (DUF1127 family)